ATGSEYPKPSRQKSMPCRKNNQKHLWKRESYTFSIGLNRQTLRKTRGIGLSSGKTAGWEGLRFSNFEKRKKRIVRNHPTGGFNATKKKFPARSMRSMTLPLAFSKASASA